MRGRELYDLDCFEGRVSAKEGRKERIMGLWDVIRKGVDS